MNNPPLPPARIPVRTGDGKAKVSTLIVAGFGLFLIVVGLISSGIGGAIIMAALLALLTGLYSLLTGRGSWARLAGRKAGAVVAAASIVGVIVGGALVPPTEATVPNATAEQTTLAETAEPTSSSTPSVSAKPKPSDKPTTTATPDVARMDTTTMAESDGDPDSPPDQPGYGVKALALLQALEIRGRAPKTGYDRDQFGQAWLDVDRNGCDTRNDTLNRDLRDIVHANSVPCKVRSGTLDDPYTGTTIPFLRGQDTSSDVQIDHIVALADAWQKGAQQLTFEQRAAFANDPLNLQATDGPTNAQKGAGDAATWLPPNRGFRCEYVARQISVKATYDLWVTQAEHDAMARVLTDCPDMMAPTNQPSPTPAPPAPAAPVPSPAPAPAPPPALSSAPAPAPGPFTNCAAARAAGAAPVYADQPGYGPHLDGDGDGVGCE